MASTSAPGEQLRSRAGTILCHGVVALALLFAASTALPALRPSAASELLWDGGVYNAVFVLAAAVCWLRAWKVARERWAWTALGGGLLFTAAGEIHWTLHLAGLAEPPFPTLGDAFYLSFYPLAYLAVALLVRSRVRDVRPGMWLDGLVCGLALASIPAALAFDAIVADSGGDTLAVLTTVAYPVGDLLLILMVAMVFGLSAGRPGRAWTLMGAGLLAWGGADFAFLLAVADGSYVEGTVLDAGWSVGAALVALCAWQPESRRAPRVGSRASLAIPSFCTLCASGVLVACASGQGSVPAVVLAAGSVAAAVARTAITFRDIRRLAETRRLPHTDELTGLPNRRALLGRLDDAVARREPVALVLLDLDGFKQLNETLGHHVCDVLLQRVAERLSDHVPTGDLIARLGGDEFAAVLARPLSAPEAVLAGREIRDALNRPYDVDGIPVGADASVGVALHPAHGRSSSELLRHADVAMYDAKENRSGVELYAPERDEHSRERLTIVSDLRAGIERGELVLHLQPQVSVTDRRLVSAEALVRWRHPELGLLAPGRFLPAVSQTSVMRPLTRRMLVESLAVAADWAARGKGLRVSVNVAAPDLLDLDFPGVVAGLVRDAGVSPALLCLEVTEDAVMADTDRAVAVLHELAAIGVGLSLDDFGTGHSSLARLVRLPVDELKIDRSFAQGIAADARNLAILRAAATLGAELELTVVAEGVESLEALDAVRAAGCHVAQGYLYAPPLPVDEFEAWAYRYETSVGAAPTAALAPLDETLASPLTGSLGLGLEAAGTHPSPR